MGNVCSRIASHFGFRLDICLVYTPGAYHGMFFPLLLSISTMSLFWFFFVVVMVPPRVPSIGLGGVANVVNSLEAEYEPSQKHLEKQGRANNMIPTRASYQEPNEYRLQSSQVAKPPNGTVPFDSSTAPNRSRKTIMK